jgi:hypothetical protein
LTSRPVFPPTIGIRLASTAPSEGYSENRAPRCSPCWRASCRPDTRPRLCRRSASPLSQREQMSTTIPLPLAGKSALVTGPGRNDWVPCAQVRRSRRLVTSAAGTPVYCRDYDVAGVRRHWWRPVETTQPSTAESLRTRQRRGLSRRRPMPDRAKEAVRWRGSGGGRFPEYAGSLEHLIVAACQTFRPYHDTKEEPKCFSPD